MRERGFARHRPDAYSVAAPAGSCALCPDHRAALSSLDQLASQRMRHAGFGPERDAPRQSPCCRKLRRAFVQCLAR